MQPRVTDPKFLQVAEQVSERYFRDTWYKLHNQSECNFGNIRNHTTNIKQKCGENKNLEVMK